MNLESARLVSTLKTIVGKARVLTHPSSTRPYRTGCRFGSGPALAVVRPRTLLEQWRVLQVCIAADKIVIAQAANTGLTGGSTPFENYDREVVIVSTLAISGVHLIDGGQQVVCLSGTTLHQLEQALKPLGREPHSVIGSSCIGASVVGGICNNSGGALISRGPAFTEMALFARANERGELQLVNHLGISLGQEPEEILRRLERGDFRATDIGHDPHLCGSDHDYIHRIRQVDAEVPNRFNSDPRRLFEASGSAGRIMVFAVRLDTFPKATDTRVFYIGTNDPAELTRLRRHVLSRFDSLPIAGEYLHREAFNIAERYGKDTFLAIRYFGTERLPRLFQLKARLDSLAWRLGLRSPNWSDRLLQGLSHCFPNHLPSRMLQYRDRFEHHLLLKMSGAGIAEAATYLSGIFPSATGGYFECTAEEGDKAFLHRFAAASAAVRYRTLHEGTVEDIVALDIALRPNDPEWRETLPHDIAAQLIHRLYYGHFFCYVFHQDYIVKKGYDTLALKYTLCRLLDERGAEYPAEHNVGHLYRAKPALVQFYHSLDPCNSFNPGLGQTSRCTHWQE